MKKFLFAVFGFKTKQEALLFIETRDPEIGLRKLAAYDDEEDQLGFLSIEDCDSLFMEAFDFVLDYYVVLPLPTEYTLFERGLQHAS